MNEEEGRSDSAARGRDRQGLVARPLPLLVALIASCAGMGYAIYALIRAMRM